LVPAGGAGAHAEDVRASHAVGADRAAVARVALAVVGGRRDLVDPPGVTAITRHSHLQGRRSGIALFLADEARPADVDVAEERAALGVVGPDLLLVGEGG